MYDPGVDPGEGHRGQMTPFLKHIWEAKNDVLV